MTIDLADKKLLNSEKNLKRLKTALERLGKFDFVLKGQKKSNNIETYFKKTDIKILERENKLTKKLHYVDCVPCLNDENISEVVEWLGMLSLNADLKPELDYVSTYETCWDETLESGQVAMLTAEGFFTPVTLQKLYNELSLYAVTRDSTHWAWLCVKSFCDAPWRCDRSAPYTASPTDHNLTFFLRPNETILYKIANKMKL